MEEKLLEATISAFVKEFIERSERLIEFLGAEGKQLVGRSLKKYLTKQQETYSYIKTLLRGLAPVYLYDIYFHLSVIDEHGAIIDTDRIVYLFEKTNLIILTGDGGSGKSTLVKHLFLNSIEEMVGIPILIELRDLNKSKKTLTNLIHDTVFENNISHSDDILERLLFGGRFVFFLDGYDELKSSIRKCHSRN